MARTYYDVLDISPCAGQQAIRRAFRDRVKETHPDAASVDGSDEFKLVHEAYETLSSSSERQRYDEFGHQIYVLEYGSDLACEMLLEAAARADGQAAQTGTQNTQSGTGQGAESRTTNPWGMGTTDVSDGWDPTEEQQAQDGSDQETQTTTDRQWTPDAAYADEAESDRRYKAGSPYRRLALSEIVFSVVLSLLTVFSMAIYRHVATPVGEKGEKFVTNLRTWYRQTMAGQSWLTGGWEKCRRGIQYLRCSIQEWNESVTLRNQFSGDTWVHRSSVWCWVVRQRQAFYRLMTDVKAGLRADMLTVQQCARNHPVSQRGMVFIGAATAAIETALSYLDRTVDDLFELEEQLLIPFIAVLAVPIVPWELLVGFGDPQSVVPFMIQFGWNLTLLAVPAAAVRRMGD